MSALALALAQDGFTREMAIRLLNGEEMWIDGIRYDLLICWYRMGNMLVRSYDVLGVDTAYVISTGEEVDI